MKISKRMMLTTIAGAVLATMATADIAAAAEPIKIGMTVSSTGRFALAAQAGERGLKIWVDDVNSRGGIEIGGGKRKIELISLDDRSDKTMVPRVYETLIKDHNIDIAFGPFGSTLTGAAANTTEQFGKFLTIWSASSDAIYNQGYKYVVSASQIAASRLGHPSVKALHAMGAKTIAFAYLDEPFPAGITKGAADLAKKLGMKVVMMEKFAKGTKDFSIIIQKGLASGADAFYPTSYEGDQMIIARQLREQDASFPAVYMVYASQTQFLEIGKDADFLVSQTLMHDKINWKVNAGLNRSQVVERYKKLFPNVAYPADFQTALAYSAGAVLEEIIKKANSVDPAKMKQAALDLNGKLTVMTGPYNILPTGKQTSMEFVIMQNQKTGTEVVYPSSVATAKAVYPMPPYSSR
ncbi:MAG: amino acid ABC transporter substrate-binding protein [Rhodospirillaceae bacterium]|jgi:branched-chain amino acid transport system substrate-binding protein|nr:amino acid ABC transporter substrate-binding protein [Rhodospirillaceae bacterium]MBT6139092.1 amino acid ABC transporter substrate-binding protein [Rhodospirillaceae bacterium]